MANRRAIVKRRKAVRNIKKITRTMQMIATARFQTALNRAVATRPFTDKLAEMVGDLSRVAEDFRHPLMTKHGETGHTALIAVTSNRGLCGGYNAHVVRAALAHRERQRKQGLKVDITMVGQKGISNLNFRGVPMAETVNTIDDQPRFEQVEPIAESLMERFLAGRVEAVHVAYMRFYSAGRQEPEVFQLLPLTEVGGEGDEETGGTVAPYEIRPSAAELLDELLPMTVRMRLFQSFNDAAVSEQIARMAAMKAATEAADEMIQNLTRQYNRARQTHITMELLDIVGGANALE
jgi:F-type H+-transporting ATPase subunit gamma